MDLTRHIRDIMSRDRLMFVYRGEVTGNNSIPLLMLLEREMVSSEFGFLGRKRLFMFVLESLQNVSRHSNRTEHADKSIVVFAKTDNGYIVTTGNVIPSSSVESLRQKLDEINKLDPASIRALYRQMLSSAEFSSKGGAGLGLLEMAKKTGNRLDYDFVDLNNGYTYFILSKSVDRSGVGYNNLGESARYNGDRIMSIESMMAESNIYLVWSGHISPDIGKEVLYFTESKLREEEINTNLKKRIFTILVEILENVARYGAGKEAEMLYGLAVATLRVEKETYVLTTGNLVRTEEVTLLKEKLDRVNSYSIADLKRIEKERLLDNQSDSGSTGMLGLVDISLKSTGKLQYAFEKVNDFYSYYLLTVRVKG